MTLEGKRVRIKAKGRIFEGIVMPSFTDCLVLKLDNGYNVGFKDYEVLEILEEKPISFPKPKIEKKEELPNVMIISTGGTIASKVDYRTGAVTSQFTAEEIVGDVPELLDVCNVDAMLLYNILSENMKPKHWIELAREVYKAIKKGYEGVIVTHGTDTMHYSASALAFMLSTPIPIVFTGAQRSSDRPSSDASMNVFCSAVTAVSDLGEVVVVMHGTTSDDYCLIHRGVKVRKCHTSRRDAFRTINYTPLGKVHYPSGEIEWIGERFKRGERELELRDKLEEKCVLIKFFPGLSPDILEYYYERGYRGFVLEGTGLGHVSTDWVDTIKRIAEDSLIVMTSQCLWGRVCCRVYDTGRYLLRAGVIEGEDMLPEVALVKVMWLLGNYDLEEAKKLVKENLVGEITPSTRYDYS
ncbi:Glu-tRNA(Gln) amidotransferase subunit GatD [Archaeoglobus profundus]|uniref:Glutamyl-tRNA(Gln) amidotransferase subunit D n=1 Tax=Archaeoglobus profundus (strain DSM 5631 / JCM 9629 / NBRC 100127 / Av18) TaxID=572546 RepID=D2RG74_ARCPA|nr:Glu-tRNA(Gln) amidotransferase subunit GatD [Archaeoglobus profundus]ADB57299.1 glutamyl-tRNA(Gln) amidotransferase, subunit D [Archaeoglobus profundus DSM 5631]